MYNVTLANRDGPKDSERAVGEKQSDWLPAAKRASRSVDTRVRLFIGSSLGARRASGSISGKCIGHHTIKEADTFFNALIW